MKITFSLSEKLQPLRLLLSTLSLRRRRQLLGLQVLSILAAAGEVANLGALLPFLRLLANPEAGLRALGPVSIHLLQLPEKHLLLFLGLAFMAVVVLSSLVRVITTLSQLRLAALITADLEQQVFASVLRRPFVWHLETNSSTVLGHLTKDVDQVSGSIQALLSMVVNLAIVVLLAGSLIFLAPGLMAVVGCLLASFYVVVYRLTRGSMRADGLRLTTNYQGSLQVAQEALGGIRDVLLDRSQLFFEQAYTSRNRSYRLAIASINSKVQIPRYLIEGFAVLLIVGLSLCLGLSGQRIESQLPLLGIIILGAYRLLQPLQQCFNALTGIQTCDASLRKIAPFLTNPKSFATLKTGNSYVKLKNSCDSPIVQLQHLYFRYNCDGPWVLKDIELSIQPGERIAFIGTTGSGKSTCSDLILGLLQPNDGRVLVEGQDLHGLPGLVESWQRRVAHVPQQIYLSDGTFISNIAFGVPAELVDLEQIKIAAQQACISQLIEASPQAYQTIVGERGVRLSGGQRQRIGIARALYKRAELLVLDEATSALDNRTEAEVMSAVEALDSNITVILIAHRLSTVERCNRIVMLDHGRISAIGTYQNLYTNSSSFRQFVNHPDSLNS